MLARQTLDLLQQQHLRDARCSADRSGENEVVAVRARADGRRSRGQASSCRRRAAEHDVEPGECAPMTAGKRGHAARVTVDRRNRGRRIERGRPRTKRFEDRIDRAGRLMLDDERAAGGEAVRIRAAAGDRPRRRVGPDPDAIPRAAIRREQPVRREQAPVIRGDMRQRADAVRGDPAYRDRP